MKKFFKKKPKTSGTFRSESQILAITKATTRSSVPREAPSPNATLNDGISTRVDSVLPITGRPYPSAGVVKDENPESGQKDASPALNSSPLWQKAIERVKTDNDWKRYKEIVTKNAALNGSEVDSPDGIVTIAKQVLDQVEKSKTTLRLAGRTIVVRDVLNKVLDVLAVTKDLGTSLTSLNPYASAAWRGLQFFIQAAVTNKEVAALCWDELPRMLRLMSQYQTFETLYDTSKLKKTRTHLEDSLVQLFSAILRYQIVIVKYASSRTDRFKAAFQDKLASMPQRVLDEIKQHEEEVAKMQILADRETVDIQFQSLTDSSKLNSQRLEKVSVELRESNLKAQELSTKTATYMESISTSIEATRRNAILTWISTLKYRDVHNNRDRKAMEGTGEWLVQHPKYLRWRSSKQAAVLWLHGLMGSGKSCLAHTVIEDVKVSTSTLVTRKLAYLYCNGSSEQGRKDIENAANILRCLLQQLSRVGEAGKLMNSIINIYEDVHLEGHLSEDQCEDLIRDLINKSETTTIVIDGLDECPLEVQKSLMTSVAGLLQGCMSSLQIFVSSRRNDNIVDLLQDLPVTEIDVGDNNTKDIERFVTQTAHEAASRPGDRRKYVKAGRSQEVTVVNRLRAKAGGMFRWVELAFKFLHASVDYDAMSSRLDQLSHLGQLFDLYDEIYDDMMRRVDAADQARIRTLLTFMLHGESTHLDHVFCIRKNYPSDICNIAEILEACEFSATGDPFNVPMSVERVRTLCPSLVVVIDTGHYKLTFPHVSVLEWLLTGSKPSIVLGTTQGHCYLAQLCMKAISASGIQPKESLDEVEDPKARSSQSVRLNALLHYSLRGWLDHLHSLVAEYNLSRPIKKIWAEEILLRTTLEDFLFNLNKQDPISPDTLCTGLQLWYKLSRDQVGDLRFNDEEGVTMHTYDKRGTLPRTLDNYRFMPLELVVPSFICAIVGHFCELSRFQEAAMEAAVNRYELPVRLLATFMGTCDIAASTWLIEQMQLSPEVLADALLLTVSSGFWTYRLHHDEEEKEEKHPARTRIPQLMRLLVASGVDVNGRYGPSRIPLIVMLIGAWLHGRDHVIMGRVVAIMTACFVELGLDALVPVHVSSKVQLGEIYGGLSSKLVVSELKTVFDWVLLWGVGSEHQGIEAVFLTQQWGKSVWTRWLRLAVFKEACSPNLVQSCLRNGADPLTTDDGKNVILHVAIESKCSGLVLDTLIAATFAADAGLRVDDFNPDGYFLARIVERCSKNTIELWNDRGADIAGITVDNRPWYWDSPLEIAKQRTKSTGDPSVEEYLRSLGITTPPGTPSLNSTSAQLENSEIDRQSLSGSSQDETSFTDSRAAAYPASHRS